ncbi:MAG: acetyl-CoA carboxylase biotin carboxylase subunit [Cyclobacteriaceae bacterium]|nr:acetyl-CoA carboxylase biotin carboxylase subunit [Cyclobacteriaceae bacterium]
MSSNKTEKRILIANRGEIALRIMRSIRDMGHCVIAIYSDVDRMAPHVLFADEAYCIGDPLSYLDIDRLVDICKTYKIDMVHPGYGFLSENAVFASTIAREGIIFIGPSAESISMMGDKLAAKSLARRHDIPVVPGSDGQILPDEDLKSIVKEIGFPVLIKASAGGGGKGMRIVKNEDELEEAIQRAASEAKEAFGDGAVFIEKYIESPRHIEVQVIADQFGNVADLFERDCSIQRRHQKVIEEAPSPKIDDILRVQLGQAAVKICKACNYYGAGTVEFLMDANNHFYFLEMNTRLQVEHPVTEFITGLDLVKEQIRIAMGEKLSFDRAQMHPRGHSIELRVCAENPMENFLPDTGRLHIFRLPAGPGVRVDEGYSEGMDVPVYYDPLLAKLIVYAENRKEAIARMKRAISEFRIEGVSNTLSFGNFVMNHHEFIDGNYDTLFIGKYWNQQADSNTSISVEESLIAAAVAAQWQAFKTSSNTVEPRPRELSLWKKRAANR